MPKITLSVLRKSPWNAFFKRKAFLRGRNQQHSPPLMQSSHSPTSWICNKGVPPFLFLHFQALENVQKFVVKFVKGLRYVPYEQARHQLRHLALACRRIRRCLCSKYHTAFSDFHSKQFLLLAPALGFVVYLSNFHQRCENRRRPHALHVRIVM